MQRIELSTRKKAAFAGVVLLASTFTAYALWCVGWSYSVYRYVKLERRGWRGEVHRPDAALGYAAIPSSSGFQTFAIGPDLPIAYDEQGFRVPPGARPAEEQSTAAPGPRLLTLGCSFTFGDAYPAEETFASQVAAQLHGTVTNAGMCSYGLAQMVLLGRELIPSLRPDLVVVQYSPWLIDRAMTCYLPAYYGVIPGPYFADTGSELTIAPPVFGWDARDFGSYRETARSLSDFLSFARSSAIPLRIHDDFGRAAVRCKQFVRITPTPCRDRNRVAAAGYDELLRLCRAANARMVIVVLGADVSAVELPAAVTDLDVPIAQAHARLIDQLPQQDEDSYRKAYANWRGDPPRMVDTHPSPHAHAIIAETIIEAVQQASGESTMATGRTGVVR